MFPPEMLPEKRGRVLDDTSHSESDVDSWSDSFMQRRVGCYCRHLDGCRHNVLWSTRTV